MENGLRSNSDLNDIVFLNRNREYGAYLLRKRYNGNVTISILVGIIINVTVIIVPYLNARDLQNRQRITERQVEIKLENLDEPAEQIAPPPPPPPPADVVQQQRYVPPQVVDSIKPEEANQLMTADQAQVEVTNEEVVEFVQEVKEEVQEVISEPEPFLSVEEMPEFPGGMNGLFKYIAENTKYPPIARDNNIQGKVFVRFCITSKGEIGKINVFKGVDPALDAEAIRVVKTFPKFKPGKQSGIPVDVWFTVYINFELN